MKEIPLTQGFVALVDDEDYDRLARFKWSAARRRHTVYAQRGVTIGRRKRTIVLMHREILGLTDTNVWADHRDGHGWNNTRQNLRAATPRQNAANAGGRGGASRFKGVVWNRKLGRWTAQIKVNRQTRYLGLFDREEEAARAYDAEALRLSGDFSRPNVSPVS
ncbi:MAG: AP2 domain-containing protein [Elusimicrobia bacterium]|nr:AP2 domain-containing protein [Elusimicrobiota bacterium]